MDWTNFIVTVSSSLIVSAAGAWSLGKVLITHLLKKDREATKLHLQEQLGKQRDEWQGEIHREVQLFLGDRAAEREYQLEAKKRLYQTIGPLRFQLLIACRELSNRVERHLEIEFSMEMSSYYGRSTLYRMLRPFAICELIEKQLSYADFSVDPSAIDLLRFKKAVGMALASAETILSHPEANWSEQREHIFHDNLSRAASRIVVESSGGAERVMNFREFDAYLRVKSNSRKLSPLPEILDDFTIESKPLLWLRLVCLGYICSEFVRKAGQGMGFDRRDFHLKEMIAASSDEYTKENADRLPRVFHDIYETGL